MAVVPNALRPTTAYRPFGNVSAHVIAHWVHSEAATVVAPVPRIEKMSPFGIGPMAPIAKPRTVYILFGPAAEFVTSTATSSRAFSRNGFFRQSAGPARVAGNRAASIGRMNTGEICRMLGDVMRLRKPVTPFSLAYATPISICGTKG